MDDDNDGVEDGGDCAPLVNSVWQPPGDIGNAVRFAASNSEIAWDNAAQMNVFDVYRGSFEGAEAFLYVHTCRAGAVPETRFADSAEPSPGVVFYYLVGGRNSCIDGYGPLGSGTGVGVRPNDDPCTAVGGDRDADLVLDINDNCPLVVNADQTDADADGLGDPCDSCPATPDPTGRDSDGDGVGDACDAD
jgi:hypothetical protein